jgi:hypothetical protein
MTSGRTTINWHGLLLEGGQPIDGTMPRLPLPDLPRSCHPPEYNIPSSKGQVSEGKSRMSGMLTVRRLAMVEPRSRRLFAHRTLGVRSAARVLSCTASMEGRSPFAVLPPTAGSLGPAGFHGSLLLCWWLAL